MYIVFVILAIARKHVYQQMLVCVLRFMNPYIMLYHNAAPKHNTPSFTENCHNLATVHVYRESNHVQIYYSAMQYIRIPSLNILQRARTHEQI